MAIIYLNGHRLARFMGEIEGLQVHECARCELMMSEHYARSHRCRLAGTERDSVATLDTKVFICNSPNY